MRTKLATTAAVLAMGLMATSVQAQDTGRFRWQTGQVLQYKVEQTTRATDTSSDGKTQITSRVEQLKRWQVLHVDANGTATLQLTLLRLAMTQDLPSGETWTFDSDKPDAGTKQLKEQLGQHVGKVLAVLRVDAYGKVVEVKSSVGPASRFDCELPFVVTLPASGWRNGQTWTRGYRLVMDPPLGAGEQYTAEQAYQLQNGTDGAAITFVTTIKDLPQGAADQLPLMQMRPRGRVTFDAKLGLMTSAYVTSGGTVEGHQGEGSKYEFSSEYKEQLVSR